MARFASAVLASALLAVAAGASGKPNIIFVLTDDQDLILDSTSATPGINSLIFDSGVVLEHGIVSTPICCPSRTISVSGRYSHNNGYLNKTGGQCMHVDAEDRVFANTSAFALLKGAGYTTAAVGKVTNDQTGYFCKDHRRDSIDYAWIPCSFNDYWTTSYFGVTPGSASMQTIPDAPSAYQTSQLGNYSEQFIRQHVAEKGADEPFFLWLGPHAPHYPADVAPWYAFAYDNKTKAPRVPSYNVSAPDHHGFITTNPNLNEIEAEFIDQHYRDRLSSLLSVDDMVKGVVNALEEAGVMERTYILYSSDHGYKMGNLNVPCSKQQPYDTDLRVPLSWRGPGIKAGTKLSIPSSNVDFLPTMLDLAGVAKPSVVDGKSVAPLMVTEPNPFYEPRAAETRESVRAGWRSGIIAEYLSVGTYYSDHCDMWFYDPTSFKGDNRKAPKANAKGQLWYVDDTKTNSFRVLRLWNDTEFGNFHYSEFDPTYVFNSSSIQIHEAYDMDKDPWSLNNIYSTLSGDKQAALHARISSYFACEGASCP